MTRWHGISRLTGLRPDGATDRPRRPRRPDLPGDLAVARGRPRRDRRGPPARTRRSHAGRSREVERDGVAAVAGPPAGPRATASAASRCIRRGSAAGTSRASSTSTPRRVSQLGVERRSVTSARRPRRRRVPWRRGGTDPTGPGSSVRMATRSGTPRVSHSRTDAILPGSMNDRTPTSRAVPADRGHDLRVVRQPDRALPRQDAGRRGRRRSTSRPRRRRSATCGPRPVAPSSSVPSRRPATTSARGRPAGSRRRADARRANWPTTTASAPEQPATCSSARWSRSRSPSGSWSSCSRRRRPSRWSELNRLVLVPATFIQSWAGGRFYRAAWRAARHGTTNMDTLVAVGTTAAWAYSCWS